MSTVKLYLYGVVVFYFMLLNKFAASQTLICAVGNQEDKVTRITCPSGSIISDVRFASYGNPEGSCGSYTVGSCHASNSMNIVSNECLNQTTCSLTPSHTIFDFNECHDEAMQLYAEVLCSVSSRVNMSISTSTFSRLSISSSIVSSSVCLDGWILYKSYCYKFNIGTGYTWSECQSKCTSLRASMLCIPDFTTNRWISSVIKDISNYDYYFSWIGYSDLPKKDGNYKWVSGCNSSYNDWIDDSHFYGNCAYTWGNGREGHYWFSESDSFLGSYIGCSCEYYPGPTSLPTQSPTSPTVIPSIVPSITPSIALCRSGWTYYNNNCYYFNVGTGYTWSGCQSQCTSLGASMLCIPDLTTNIWITRQIKSLNSSKTWIGYSDRLNEDRNFKWKSGCSSTYISFYFADDSNCAYINNDGSWYSSYDYYYSSYIGCSCEYYPGPTSLPTISPTSPTVIPSILPSNKPTSEPSFAPSFSCRSGWINYNNNCYYFNVGTRYTWSGCQSQCTSLGASMLCISDYTTNSWIADQMKSIGSSSNSWIGYSDLPNKDRKFKWVSGCYSTLDKRDDSFNYNSYYYGFNCAYISSVGSWKNSADLGSSSVLCSCEYYPGPTSLPTITPSSPTMITTLVPSTLSPTVNCQSGWKLYNSKCYKFGLGTSSWSGCKSQCTSLGASMLCIPDSTTDTWIVNQISLYRDLGYFYTWIGLSDLPPNRDLNYEWVSGCYSSYTNWNVDSEVNSYSESVIVGNSGDEWLTYTDSAFYMISCSCEYTIGPTSSPVISTISPSTGCQSGWKYYNNNCYYFNLGTGYSWSGCQSQCNSLDASMLCIPDSTTDSWIIKQIGVLGYYYSWFGYSDLPKKNGNYKWESGCSSSYTNWYYDTALSCAATSIGGWILMQDVVYGSLILCSCEYSLTKRNTKTSSYTLSSSSLSVGAIIGIVLGSIFIITVTIGCCFVLWKRMHDAKVAIDDSKYNDNSSSNQESDDFTPSYPDEEHPITAFVELPIAEADNVHYYTDDVLPTTNKGVIENI